MSRHITCNMLHLTCDVWNVNCNMLVLHACNILLFTWLVTMVTCCIICKLEKLYYTWENRDMICVTSDVWHVLCYMTRYVLHVACTIVCARCDVSHVTDDVPGSYPIDIQFLRRSPGVYLVPFYLSHATFILEGRLLFLLE